MSIAVERETRQRVSAATFVGRERELATLAQVLAAAPAVAVVEGEAGIGKTRLVAELREHAELAGRRFLSGDCRRIREPFPLGPVIEAVRSLRGDPAGTRLSPVAGALRPLLPELDAVLPPAPAPLQDRAAERHRVFRALSEVLTSIGPVVLAVEDAHWADEHTVDFLHYLLGDPPTDLSLLVTFRGEEVDPGVRAVAASLPSHVGRAHVTLAPLAPAQAGALVAAILGVDRVSEEFATYLSERASGLPFVIEELLALMQAQGVLTRRSGSWVRRAIDELDVPAGVRDPVRERFGRLSDDARSIAEAAAVLQVPTPAPVLVATSRLAGPGAEARAMSGVEAALESSLLVEHADGHLVGFRHVLAAQAIYEAIPGTRRQQLHARAAAALAALDPPPLGQRAHHLRHSGQVAAWVEAAEQAAGQAAGLGHDDEAARLLEDVLRDAPLPAEQRARLAVKLAEAAHQVLHFGEDTIELLSAELSAPMPRAMRGELRLRLALLLERTGTELARQRVLLAEAVEDLEHRPELMAHAMAGLGIPCVPGLPLSEHTRWLDRVLEVLPAVADPALQVSLLGKVAMVQVAVGDRRWRELVDRMVAETGGVPGQPAEMSAFHSVGANACYAGHLDRAQQLLAAVLERIGTGEGRWRELAARATLVLLDFCRGEWEGLALRAADLAEQLADHAPGRADVEVVAGALALARGEADQSSAGVRELAHRLAQQGAFDVLPFIAAAAIRLAFHRADHAGAAEQAHRFVAAVESVPLVVSAAWALPAVTEALVAGGEAEQARSLVSRWSDHWSPLDAPLAAAVLPRARGVLAVADGRWDGAAAEFRVAAARYDQLGCPYEAAQAREQAGAALLRCGDGDAGAEQLHAALLCYQRLGASWDLSRAAGLARQYAVSVPARHRGGRRGYGEELSPREREVADLAAQGLRNREIAAALFVSTSTVRKHLAAAMRKLDAASRTALAHRLATGGADDS